MPARISDSTYTCYVTGGPGADAYASLEQAVDLVSRYVQSATGPTFSYVYFPDVDSAEHELGVDAFEAWQQVVRLDRELDRLRKALPDDARVVLSADHGQMTVPEDQKRLLDDRDEIRKFLRVWPPAGEPRMTSFHTRPGARLKFASAFRARYGDDFLLLSTEEAETARLFGPAILSPEARARLGDFIAVPVGTQVLIYTREPGVFALKGMHGGLSAEEMRIPLVVG